SDWEKPVKFEKEEPTLILMDNIPSAEHASHIKTDGGIIIKIRRNYYVKENVYANKELKEEDKWKSYFPSQFFITNEGQLRLFEQQIRDLVKSQIALSPIFKNCVDILEK